MNKQKVRLSAVQLSSAADVSTNLSSIDNILTQITISTKEATHLVVLPECCLFFGGDDCDQLNLAKKNAQTDELNMHLAMLAKKHRVYLVAGTIPILATGNNLADVTKASVESVTEKFTNTSCMYSPEGALLGRYDKIHLFDVTVTDSTKSYCESRYTNAGKELTVVNTAFANIGLSVCFDLRFPQLFQQLRQTGADIITVPSAFTKVTGEAHWQSLLRARAIENQVYIIAAGQEGVHDNGRETWGHSMIINPWGDIENIIEQGAGYISVDYKPEEIARIRQSMPLVSPLHTLYK